MKRLILTLTLAAALAGVVALGGCELDEPTLGGTVVSVMEAERGEDVGRLEPSAKHYEDPLVPEIAWQLEVQLDNGTAATVVGTRRYEPGARVRLLVGEDGALLL